MINDVTITDRISCIDSHIVSTGLDLVVHSGKGTNIRCTSAPPIVYSRGVGKALSPDPLGSVLNSAGGLEPSLSPVANSWWS